MAGKTDGQTRTSVPYYEQVANILRTRISESDTTRSVRLPTERDLCLIHKVSRITISRALSILEQEGLVERAPGRGTRTVPEAIGQWKRLRQSRVIFVVVGSENLEAAPGSYYGQIYQGILGASELAGYRVSVKRVHAYRTDIERNPYLPEPEACLGIIFVGIMNEPTLQIYTQAGYQVVCVDYWPTTPGADGVVVDCYSEGQTAVRFLLSQGHRDLFYVGNMLTFRPPPEKESDAVLFLAGMQRALELSGEPPMRPERILFSEGLQSCSQEVTKELLSLRPRPTAGIVFGSTLCQGILDCFEREGVHCPADVSIMTKLPEGASGHITSLQSDPRKMGELAVETLLNRVRSRRTAGLRVAIGSSLHPGQTVRPV